MTDLRSLLYLAIAIILVFGIPTFLFYLWSDLSGRHGSDRWERELDWVDRRLTWIEAHPGQRITPPGERETDRCRHYLPKVKRIVNRWGGCPDDIVDRIDKLERGRWG